MTAEEFVKRVALGGYNTTRYARSYIKKHPKEEYTEEDIIEVYEQREARERDCVERYCPRAIADDNVDEGSWAYMMYLMDQ